MKCGSPQAISVPLSAQSATENSFTFYIQFHSVRYQAGNDQPPPPALMSMKFLDRGAMYRSEKVNLRIEPGIAIVNR
jgi:hypothetical protein